MLPAAQVQVPAALPASAARPPPAKPAAPTPPPAKPAAAAPPRPPPMESDDDKTPPPTRNPFGRADAAEESTNAGPMPSEAKVEVSEDLLADDPSARPHIPRRPAPALRPSPSTPPSARPAIPPRRPPPGMPPARPAAEALDDEGEDDALPEPQNSEKTQIRPAPDRPRR
ncbi:hypothetical protein KRR26_27235 [Corallococcus sp. M34]|uniref:hypothetical protein n=1 Tax=Citreicoccus inhibens TaxID=2849499 RepID=UPI001C2373FE|nr:hypothetical protein [Citreicoccus inhibens]MBU8899317.1 hypothetical protein [Citreicoccus inhibens]